MKLPNCPDWMPGAGATEWKRLVTGMKDLIDGADYGLLVAYCEAFAEFHEAVAILAREGAVVASENGYKRPHPAMTIKNRAAERMAKVGRDFGLSPAARMRVESGHETTRKDDLDEFTE